MGCASSKKQRDSGSQAPRVVVGLAPPFRFDLDESDCWQSEHATSNTYSIEKSSHDSHSSHGNTSPRTRSWSKDDEDFWTSQYAREQYSKPRIPRPDLKYRKQQPSDARKTRRVTIEKPSGELAITKALRLSKFYVSGKKNQKQQKEEYVEEEEEEPVVVVEQEMKYFGHPTVPSWMRPSTHDKVAAPRERGQEHPETKTCRTDGKRPDNERVRRPSKAGSKYGDDERRRRRPSKAGSKHEGGSRRRRPSKAGSSISNSTGDRERKRRPSKSSSTKGDSERRRRSSKTANKDHERDIEKQRRPSKTGSQGERYQSKHRNGNDDNLQCIAYNQKLPSPPAKSDLVPAHSRGRVAAVIEAITALESKSVDSSKKNNNNDIINKYRSPPVTPKVRESIANHPAWPTMGENKFINGTHSNTQNSFMFGRWSYKRTGFKHKKSNASQNQILPSNMSLTPSYCPDF